MNQISDDSTNVWFITGTSRGLGRVLVEAALHEGYLVAATTRHPALLSDLRRDFGDRMLVLRVELSERDQVHEAVRTAAERFGAIDVVVNNAAWAVFSPAEDLNEHDLRTQIEVNFLGAAYVSQAVIPIFRKRGSGRIIQISSIATRRPGAGLAGYSAAKWALAGFSSSLALEVEPFNVKVTLVEPGGMRTTMMEETHISPMRPEYRATAGREMERLLARQGQEPIDPAKVAQVILSLANETDPPLRLVLGSGALAAATAMQQHQITSDEVWASMSRSVDFSAE
jgi:NAD(P)-dependent dehydrogenase (short-subunit alcohol dehydrogenase family)